MASPWPHVSSLGDRRADINHLQIRPGSPAANDERRFIFRKGKESTPVG